MSKWEADALISYTREVGAISSVRRDEVERCSLAPNIRAGREAQGKEMSFLE
jgi:hypothetical protein